MSKDVWNEKSAAEATHPYFQRLREEKREERRRRELEKKRQREEEKRKRREEERRKRKEAEKQKKLSEKDIKIKVSFHQTLKSQIMLFILVIVDFLSCISLYL